MQTFIDFQYSERASAVQFTNVAGTTPGNRTRKCGLHPESAQPLKVVIICQQRNRVVVLGNFSESARHMELSFTKNNGEIDDLIDDIIKKASATNHPNLVREMIITALKAGQEIDYLADLKLFNNTMKEMRYTSKV